METKKDQSLEQAKLLIEQLKEQLGYEAERIMAYKQEMYRERDFKVRKFYYYNGPNYYLDTQAVVFNIFIAPNGDSVEFMKEKIVEVFPNFAEKEFQYVIDLYAAVLMHVMKMDIDLYINKHSITTDGDEYTVAIEFLDRYVAEDAATLVANWFRAISNDTQFDMDSEFKALQADFDKTFFGGPTLYSLIEAGLKRNIPVFYLNEENQFQWGYGKKQLRGRSTTFHTDSIKDTEFTMFKDMVGDFLIKHGLPTPIGKNCFSEEEIVAEAKVLGFPVVVKPVAGHKGQGVVTGIETIEEVLNAFRAIVNSSVEAGVPFDGALIQQQIYGTDHRLIAVDGQFVAALERVPAFVIGDGKSKIKELIQEENKKVIRLDNARSPLCKIDIDNNLKDYLAIQSKTIETIPAENEKIFLRRVANISAGGVSINVTENIHPDNIKLVQNIARYFNVKCLGIDVLAKDISKPWREGNFGIIEINAGPGVFMHLAPAYGGSIDVPGKIILSHFKEAKNARIPIIAGNLTTQNFSNKLYEKLNSIKPDLYFGSLTEEGVFFNNEYYHKNPEHDSNIEIILRNPDVEMALFTHYIDDIHDFGIMHHGADIVILDRATEVEQSVLTKQLFEDGVLVEATEDEIYIKKNGEVINTVSFKPDDQEDFDNQLLYLIEPYLKDIIFKYEL